MSIRRLTPLAAALAVAAVLPGAASAAEVVREGDALVVRAAPGSAASRPGHPVAPATGGQTPRCADNRGSDPSSCAQRGV